DDSSTALYFLGRLAENAGESSSARTYYSEVVREYPNYFYTTLARERLVALGAAAAASSPAGEFLRGVAFNTRSRVRNFDPNPTAVSVASARGLTQLLPSTGRELSRRLKIRPYSTARLFQPQVNLQMGSYYLRSVADSVEGRWEAALAAYNAGLSRAKSWSNW